MKTTYTIEQLDKTTIYDKDVLLYLCDIGPKLSELYNNKLDYKNTPYEALADKCIFLVCRRNGEIRGHMICHIFHSPLDPKVKILYQLSFYVKPDSGRTAYHLFHKFIDIGKDRANHIITMLTSQTNIKPSTLESLGFKELETLYRMELT
jgi:hypothetical protein